MNRKRLIVLLGLAAALSITGCGNTKKETAETEFSTAAPEEVAEEDLAAEELLEEDTEEEQTLEPITPSDYLIEDTSDYIALGEVKGLEVTQYTYEITDDMVDEQIQYELEMYSEEVEVDRASASGDIIYLDLTSTVSGEDTESESTYFYLGDEEYGAEFDEQYSPFTYTRQLPSAMKSGLRNGWIRPLTSRHRLPAYAICPCQSTTMIS